MLFSSWFGFFLYLVLFCIWLSRSFLKQRDKKTSRTVRRLIICLLLTIEGKTKTQFGASLRCFSVHKQAAKADNLPSSLALWIVLYIFLYHTSRFMSVTSCKSSKTKRFTGAREIKRFSVLPSGESAACLPGLSVRRLQPSLEQLALMSCFSSRQSYCLWLRY